LYNGGGGEQKRSELAKCDTRHCVNQRMNVAALPWAIDHVRKGIAREREKGNTEPQYKTHRLLV
jgi:hypothetical protein